MSVLESFKFFLLLLLIYQRPFFAGAAAGAGAAVDFLEVEAATTPAMMATTATTTPTIFFTSSFLPAALMASVASVFRESASLPRRDSCVLATSSVPERASLMVAGAPVTASLTSAGTSTSEGVSGMLCVMESTTESTVSVVCCNSCERKRWGWGE